MYDDAKNLSVPDSILEFKNFDNLSAFKFASRIFENTEYKAFVLYENDFINNEWMPRNEIAAYYDE